MPFISIFTMIFLVNIQLEANSSIRKYDREICSSKKEEVLFYDNLVYTIKKTGNSTIFNPLGIVGKQRVESSEIWQSAAAWKNQPADQYFLNSGYSMLKHKTGLYIIEGQTAVISKAKCKFMKTDSHFQPWDCLASLKGPFDETFAIKIKANRKKINLAINDTKLSYKNPALLKAGITAKGDKAVIIWFNTNNVFLTVGPLQKFNKCQTAQKKDYPVYITDQIIGDNQFTQPVVEN
tara:strand:- start:633 stop:1340 length:708 start_codon:yes stop_codon:yes gene_type:complete